jgi:hypothetical protein
MGQCRQTFKKHTGGRNDLNTPLQNAISPSRWLYTIGSSLLKFSLGGIRHSMLE